jgi:hypothetical protein
MATDSVGLEATSSGNFGRNEQVGVPSWNMVIISVGAKLFAVGNGGEQRHADGFGVTPRTYVVSSSAPVSRGLGS